MFKFIKFKIINLLNLYPSYICKQEYESQEFPRFNERPVEYGFVFRKIAELYPHAILDIGPGTTSLPHMMHYCGPMVTAIDNVGSYWPNGMYNRHYHILDDDIIKTRIKEKFDLITCISVLEHIEEADKAIGNMYNLLKPNGHLIMTFPYSERGYIRNVYELPGSSYGQDKPYITQSFSRFDLSRWLQMDESEIIEQEYWQFWEGDFWTVGPKVIPPRKVNVDDKHQLSCIHIKKGQCLNPI
jgi:SAM-dependent methyltransferase